MLIDWVSCYQILDLILNGLLFPTWKFFQIGRTCIELGFHFQWGLFLIGIRMQDSNDGPRIALILKSVSFEYFVVRSSVSSRPFETIC